MNAHQQLYWQLCYQHILATTTWNPPVATPRALVSIETPRAKSAAAAQECLTMEDLEVMYQVACAPPRFRKGKRDHCAAFPTEYFECKACGKPYLRSDGVRKHWRKRHPDVPIRRGVIGDFSIRRAISSAEEA